jgi:hypothetical protein
MSETADPFHERAENDGILGEDVRVERYDASPDGGGLREHARLRRE